MAEEMANIDIRNFGNAQTVDDRDYVILSLFDGTSAKLAVGLFRTSVTSTVLPSIKDGVWWIGSVNTEVAAEGATPELRRGELGVEYKYPSEDESAWRLLVPFEDIRMDFDRLTEDQRDQIRFNFDDLTTEEIAKLQEPATDMIAVLEATDKKANEAEAGRVSAENERVKAEMARSEAENKRVTAETSRASAEGERASSESTRKTNEAGRVAYETERKSAETARISAEDIRKNNESTRVNQEASRVTTEKARVSAEQGRVSEFARLKSESEAATTDAQDTADHPTYIGEDNYVYKWSKTAQNYDKTSVYVRGEAFSIKKVYASVSDMYADTTTAFKEGDFCLINTGSVEDPENGQLFVRSTVSSWDFLVDMSGAIGFTGKTPQLFIGTVSIGSGKNSAAVTLSPSGTDGNGNPMYNINYVIPCLAYEDLTTSQIAELQRPASEMIAVLQSTDDAVKEAESLRVAAEKSRVSAESGRVSAESLRVSAENGRVSAESKRSQNESSRISQENARVDSESARAEAEALRISSEKTRETNENTRKSNEQGRVSAENARVSAEQERMSSENARVSAETARTSAESGRVSAEKGRTSNESTRTENESLRQSAESVRKESELERKSSESEREEAERQRAEDYAVLREDMAAATKEAWDTSAEVRNIPVIKDGTWWVWDVDNDSYKDSGSSATGRSPQIMNGTWWTWDDSKGVYVDTGQSVSSTYQLTKEKVEGVLVGDIVTHTHTHLVYYAQVYDSTPDFSMLTEWAGADGMKHDFVPGNDIYVADADEPTGYANYKLAHSTSGNVWVRIPQLPEGYRIVLVPKE